MARKTRPEGPPMVGGLVLDEQMDVGDQGVDDVASDCGLRLRRAGEVDAANHRPRAPRNERRSLRCRVGKPEERCRASQRRRQQSDENVLLLRRIWDLSEAEPHRGASPVAASSSSGTRNMLSAFCPWWLSHSTSSRGVLAAWRTSSSLTATHAPAKDLNRSPTPSDSLGL
jgi:hypothetical protein